MPKRILKITASLTGWVLLCLLAWHFRKSLLLKTSSLFLHVSAETKLEQMIQTKKSEIYHTPWRDERPLILMLGDSQVEMGNWYALFQGAFAIQNGGLSQAKITDVIRLSDEIFWIKPAMVILMCGINDLGAGRSVDDTLKDYRQLLEQVCADVAKERIVVMSIMPVASIRPGDGSRSLNACVKTTNASLQEHCDKLGIIFLDITPVISTNGALNVSITSDGLHLNPTGYQLLAGSIEPLLSRQYAQIRRK